MIDVDETNAPAAAIEVLRMSEYVFRVNPNHWHETDASTGTGFGTNGGGAAKAGVGVGVGIAAWSIAK